MEVRYVYGALVVRWAGAIKLCWRDRTRKFSSVDSFFVYERAENVIRPVGTSKVLESHEDKVVIWEI